MTKTTKLRNLRPGDFGLAIGLGQNIKVIKHWQDGVTLVEANPETIASKMIEIPSDTIVDSNPDWRL